MLKEPFSRLTIFLFLNLDESMNEIIRTEENDVRLLVVTLRADEEVRFGHSITVRCCSATDHEWRGALKWRGALIVVPCHGGRAALLALIMVPLFHHSKRRTTGVHDPKTTRQKLPRVWLCTRHDFPLRAVVHKRVAGSVTSGKTAPSSRPTDGRTRTAVRDSPRQADCSGARPRLTRRFGSVCKV